MWSGYKGIKSTSTTIEHRLAIEIKKIFCIKQTCFKGKEYLVKYTSCHHKKAIWMKFAHLDHLLEMANKFKQEWGHELGVKGFKRKRKTHLPTTSMLMRTSTFKVEENTHKINYSLNEG
jgi:hypothetical protein